MVAPDLAGAALLQLLDHEVAEEAAVVRRAASAPAPKAARLLVLGSKPPVAEVSTRSPSSIVFDRGGIDQAGHGWRAPSSELGKEGGEGPRGGVAHLRMGIRAAMALRCGRASSASSARNSRIACQRAWKWRPRSRRRRAARRRGGHRPQQASIIWMREPNRRCCSPAISSGCPDHIRPPTGLASERGRGEQIDDVRDRRSTTKLRGGRRTRSLAVREAPLARAGGSARSAAVKPASMSGASQKERAAPPPFRNRNRVRWPVNEIEAGPPRERRLIASASALITASWTASAGWLNSTSPSWTSLRDARSGGRQ